MSTYLLNPNDTIILKNTIVLKSAEVAEKSQSIVIENNNETIVVIVCGTIIVFAIIATIVISILHYEELKKRREVEIEKAKIDKEMKEYEISRKEAEEWNRYVRYFQKTIFDKIVAKKIEEEKVTKEEDWKNLHKKIMDYFNDIFDKFKM